MASAINRAQFLRGDFRGERTPTRPPWAVDEIEFVDRCIRCDQCITNCPEHILVKGQGGFPQVDFLRGECTFCHACVDQCHEQALIFNPHSTPWQLKAQINESCIAMQGVVCMTCSEQCEVEAIHFQHRVGGAPLPQVNVDECTGCGACYKPCPTKAINLVQNSIPNDIHEIPVMEAI